MERGKGEGTEKGSFRLSFSYESISSQTVLMSKTMTLQVVQFDGGEYNFMAGEFNELEKVSTEEWNMIDNVVKQQKFTES